MSSLSWFWVNSNLSYDLISFNSINKLPQVVKWTPIIHGRQCQNSTKIATNRHCWSSVYGRQGFEQSNIYSHRSFWWKRSVCLSYLLLHALENVAKENCGFRALHSQLNFCKKHIKLNSDPDETLFSWNSRAKFSEDLDKGLILRVARLQYKFNSQSHGPS